MRTLIHVPKTGGTSIGKEEDIIKLPHRVDWSTVKNVENLFIIFRDPIERFISSFFAFRKTFEEYTPDTEGINQLINKLETDEYLKLQILDGNIRPFIHWINECVHKVKVIKFEDYPFVYNLNKSNKTDVILTKKSIEILKRIYSKDYEYKKLFLD